MKSFTGVRIVRELVPEGMGQKADLGICKSDID